MPAKAGVHKPTLPLAKRHAVPEESRQARRALHTWSKEWRAIRACVLVRQPLCVSCLAEKRHTPAAEVDHIDGDDSNNVLGNLQGLCKRCHSRKTGRENRGFGNRRAK